MINEISTFNLIGSERWELLLREIKKAQRQGITADQIYHLLDRLPGSVRKELHDFFRKEGSLIDDPLFRCHINPWETLGDYLPNEPDSLADTQYRPIVNRTPESVRNHNDTVTSHPVIDKEEKKAFSRQFNTGSGMDAFSKAFMSDSDPTPIGDGLSNEVEDALFGDRLSEQENPSGVLVTPRPSDPRDNFKRIRETLN